MTSLLGTERAEGCDVRAGTDDSTWTMPMDTAMTAKFWCIFSMRCSESSVGSVSDSVKKCKNCEK